MIAQKLTSTALTRKYPLRILAATPRTVTVDATDSTSLPGEWGLFLRRGGHVRVSGIPQINGTSATWRLAGDAVAPAPGDYCAWSGIVAPNPVAAGMTSVDHLFTTSAGVVPAWYIDAVPGERRRVWAVHIHGLGSSRAGTLRGVMAASDAGLASVVPAYRNTAEGPRVSRGRSHLGLTEADDIDAVLEQISVGGDERFVLFGWSMGAQIALRLAAGDRWGSRIDRLVLDSPVLNWRNVIAANVVRSGLPASAGKLAESWLEHPRKSQIVGLDTPIDLDEMDWVRRARDVRQPTLIHHGTLDWSVPVEDSRAFAGSAPNARLLAAAGGHTTSWNVGAKRWNDATVGFLGGLGQR